jgi:hypothetical protein
MAPRTFFDSPPHLLQMIPLIAFTFNHFHSVKQLILGIFSVRHILEIPGETAADITRTLRNTEFEKDTTYRENKMPSAFVTSPISEVLHERRYALCPSRGRSSYLLARNRHCASTLGGTKGKTVAPQCTQSYSSKDFPKSGQGLYYRGVTLQRDNRISKAVTS